MVVMRSGCVVAAFLLFFCCFLIDLLFNDVSVKIAFTGPRAAEQTVPVKCAFIGGQLRTMQFYKKASTLKED